MQGFSTRRLAGFVAVPLISAIAPLVVIPAITAQLGGAAWASVAVAQSVGSAGGVLVELGWGLNGPQRVAKAAPKSRSRIYALSVGTKALVAIPTLIPVLAITAFVAPSDVPSSLVLAIAFMLSAFSPAWYLIGEGLPARILLIDAVPRLAAASMAALLIGFFGATLAIYAGLMLIAAAIPPWLGWRFSRARVSVITGLGRRRLFWLVRAQGYALGGRAASALYIALPVALVGLSSPSSLVLFSAAERLMRLSLALLQSVPNSLQAWVGSVAASDPASRKRRVRRAIAGNVVVGLIAGAGFAALAPWVSTWLFSGEANLGHELSILAGIVILITCSSRATGGLGLVAQGNIRAVAFSAACGAIVGIPGILILSHLLGAAGGFLGEVLAESTVIFIQIVALWRAGVFRRN
jgi:O-antigen/teichoic acid export membrane protein